MPLRNDIGVPKEHAVQSVAGGDERIAVRREDDLVHQRINGPVLDADDVPRAGLVRRRRGPEVALLISRRVRFRKDADDNVEVEIVLAPFLLRRVQQLGQLR